MIFHDDGLFPVVISIIICLVRHPLDVYYNIEEVLFKRNTLGASHLLQRKLEWFEYKKITKQFDIWLKQFIYLQI